MQKLVHKCKKQHLSAETFFTEITEDYAKIKH